MQDFDICIVGAGVIGLAIAARLAKSCSVLVLEQHPQVGTETSSRNSEVIHAGLYYAPDSLKETLCIRGRHLLYEHCQQYQVSHQKAGKLVVSQSADNPALQALCDNATRLDIQFSLLNRSGIKNMEPEVSALAALHSPETGIIDSHGYMLSLQHMAESQGAIVALNTHLIDASPHNGGWHLHLNTLEGEYNIGAGLLINAAGLQAVEIFNKLHPQLASVQTVRMHPARGHYFSYSGKSPFKRLIYPMPEPGLAGLGIHATLDMGGRLKFGPDVEFLNRQQLDSNDRYQVSDTLKDTFATAIRQYWPSVDEQRLTADYAGIRPKISGPGDPARDFYIASHNSGQSQSIQLLGIESPGLTASLAIAEYVEQLLGPL